MRPDTLRTPTLFLLLPGLLSAVQPLGAGNVSAKAKVMAGVALVAGGAYQWLAPQPNVPLAAFEDPILHRQILAGMQERYGPETGTTLFQAGLERGWQLQEQEEGLDAQPDSLFRFREPGTEACFAAFRAHIEQQKDLFAKRAEASADEVKLRRWFAESPLPGAKGQGHSASLMTRDQALGMVRNQERALAMSELLSRFYQSIHRVLRGVNPADMTDLESIRRLDQEVRAACRPLARRIELEDTLNLMLIKILDMELQILGSKPENRYVREAMQRDRGEAHARSAMMFEARGASHGLEHWAGISAQGGFGAASECSYD
jgi:hypothetical protein